MGADPGSRRSPLARSAVTQAEEVAADRIARAIEKGAGLNMETAARIARAAVGYMRDAGVEIGFAILAPDAAAGTLEPPLALGDLFTGPYRR